MKRKNLILAGLFGLVFVVLGVATLGDYGISWDETGHFRRGQAYLHYFLTGRTDYQDLPVRDLQGTEGDPKRISVPRRSLFQDGKEDAAYFLKNDGAHPVINDELAALSNYLLFQKWGMMGDVEAYHVFNVLAASLLVFVVVCFSAETFGVFAGMVAGLSLVTYPLFFAESHFNIKDPPEAAFFAAIIWAFWKAVERKSVGWWGMVFVFGGLALGTKYNVLFLPFILVPWLVWRFRKDIGNLRRAIRMVPSWYWKVGLAGVILVAVVFVGSWPFLWQDLPGNLGKSISYYEQVGTGFRYQPDGFYILGWNVFPLLWILFTTPPVVLGLFALGVVAVWLKRRERRGVSLLWLVWFVVPILRVSIPGTTIYGGVRQIMEFLPAMALISGLGAGQIGEWIKRGVRGGRSKRVLVATVQLGVVVMFVWPILILVRMHPNENVYFNSLIGGLAGAARRDFPSWGNSFGNAYRQAAEWLNGNVEEGAKVALLQGTSGNLPVEWLRSDLNFDNHNWSGINRGGEYLVELTFNDTGKSFFYAWEYVEKFLVLVYEVNVDGVAIAKIWKNDLGHTKPEWRWQEKEYMGEKKILVTGGNLTIDLGEAVNLSRVRLVLAKDGTCVPVGGGFVETSIDGKGWVREKDWLTFQQVGREENVIDGNVEFFWAGREAQWVRFVFDSEKSCGLKVKSWQVKIF